MKPKAPIPDGFGQRLSQAIADAGLTQRKVAARLRVDEAAVSRWVRGRSEPEDLATLVRLATMLRVSVDWLLGLPHAREPVPVVELNDVAEKLGAAGDALRAAVQGLTSFRKRMSDE